MKQVIFTIGGLLLVGATFAQKAGGHAKGGSNYFGNTAVAAKDGVWGTIKNGAGDPMTDVEVMVYKVDTIEASGYTDAMGRYTTSSCAAGKYTVKIVYPNNKYAIVNGVEIKKGRVMLDMKANMPAADTVISYADLQPKKEKAKTPGKR
jgi:Carboxypeptidase regulatory-like domain